MFTKIAKAVVWLGVILGIVASLIFGGNVCSAAGDNGGLWGFFIIYGGILISFFASSFLGMLVEMAEDTHRTRELLESMKFGTSCTVSGTNGMLAKLQALNS